MNDKAKVKQTTVVINQIIQSIEEKHPYKLLTLPLGLFAE